MSFIKPPRPNAWVTTMNRRRAGLDTGPPLIPPEPPAPPPCTGRPVLVSADPADGSTTSVPPASIVFVFDSPITSLNLAELFDTTGDPCNSDTGTPVPFTSSVAGNMVTLTPTSPLSPGSNYFVFIVVDNGCGPTAATACFDTCADAPGFLSSIPADQSANVDPGISPSFTFDAPVDLVGAVFTETSALTPCAEGTPAVDFTAGVVGAVVTLTQTTPPLLADVDYFVQVEVRAAGAPAQCPTTVASICFRTTGG